ncbi:hypothetical protein [Pseudonocardia sp. H11422]|nr:hypothetical protein [Pseudonocardia sp. H11422]
MTCEVLGCMRSGDVLFLELEFHATIGGRPVSVPAVPADHRRVRPDRAS